LKFVKNHVSQMAKTFILSDNTKNSYGFSLDMEKLDIERFKNNPVMLYNHWNLIGKWKNIALKEGVLTAEPEFMNDPEEKDALLVKNRVEKGFLKGASLGIRVLDSSNKDKVVAEVMEASIVDIPSNKNALALYDESGNKLEGEAFQLALSKITKQNQTEHTMTKIKLSAAISHKLGLPQEVETSEVEAKLEALHNENVAMQDKLKAIHEEKVKTLIDTALSEGRITADNKDKFEELAKANFDLAKSTIETLPKAEKLSGKEKPTDKHQGDRSDWTFDDWRKKDTAGLLRIKQEDPERYQQIINS